MCIRDSPGDPPHKGGGGEVPLHRRQRLRGVGGQGQAPPGAEGQQAGLVLLKINGGDARHRLGGEARQGGVRRRRNGGLRRPPAAADAQNQAPGYQTQGAGEGPLPRPVGDPHPQLRWACGEALRAGVAEVTGKAHRPSLQPVSYTHLDVYKRQEQS